jgi:hypothetical protein
MSLVLTIHICGGTVGLASGAAAVSFRKGSPRHVIAGKIFVLSMLIMASGAIHLAVLKHQPGNFFGGLSTFYLILTGWLTARRADGQTSRFDWAALLIPLLVASTNYFFGVEKLRSPSPPNDGVPAGMNFFMGSVMMLAALGDVRMLLRAGVLGVKRIRRHLWRMCFGLFIATGSFFLGPNNRPLRLLSSVGLRQQFLRVLLREEVLLFLAILPLLLLIFWLIRVRFTRAYAEISVPRSANSYSAST